MSKPMHNETQPQPTPLDGKSFAIGILSITSCILFVGFLLITATPDKAYGIGHLDRQGDYIMFTHQVSNAREGIIVVDAAVKKAHLYSLQNRKDLQLMQRLELDRLPGTVERDERRLQGGG